MNIKVVCGKEEVCLLIKICQRTLETGVKANGVERVGKNLGGVLPFMCTLLNTLVSSFFVDSTSVYFFSFFFPIKTVNFLSSSICGFSLSPQLCFFFQYNVNGINTE